MSVNPVTYTFDDRAIRYAQAWRDDVPKGMLEEHIMQEPGAPVKGAEGEPQPTTNDILLRMESSFNSRLDGLTSEITKLNTKVGDLNDTVGALSKQVSNLTNMSTCDKLKTLVPCSNHLQTVSMRGLTDRQIKLVTKSGDKITV